MSDAETRAADGFVRRFGRAPDGVWRAPGRVNLIGEHTDYNDGFVMPFAIDRATCVAARRRDDRMIEVSSETFGDAPPITVDDVVPQRTGGWSAYVHGVIAELGAPLGLELYVASDVPAGAGLSSSAALECATAVAVVDLASADRSPMELALAAQRAEHRFAGVPCGIMDQMAAMLGVGDHALLIDARARTVEPIPLAIPGHVALVIDTGVKHALADGAYAERRRACERAASILGVPALRDATPGAVDRAAPLLGPELLRRARHVVTENARVVETAGALREGDMPTVRRAMLDSHASLRDDYEVSSAELDVAVEAAVDAGALAARMTGGGFGGSAVALVPARAVEGVERAVSAAFDRSRLGEPAFHVVRASAGAHRVA